MDIQEIEALKREIEEQKKGEKNKQPKNGQGADERGNGEEQKNMIPSALKPVEQISPQKPDLEIIKSIEKNLKPLEKRINNLNDSLFKNIESYKDELSNFTGSVKSFRKNIQRVLFLNFALSFGLAVVVLTGCYQIIEEINELNLNLSKQVNESFISNGKNKNGEVRKNTASVKTNKEKKNEVNKTNVEEKIIEKKSDEQSNNYSKEENIKKVPVKKEKAVVVNQKSVKVNNYAVIDKFKIKRYNDKKEGKSISAKGKIKNIGSETIDFAKLNIKLLSNDKKTIYEAKFNVVAKGNGNINGGVSLKKGEDVSFSVRVGPDSEKWGGQCKYWLADLAFEGKKK